MPRVDYNDVLSVSLREATKVPYWQLSGYLAGLPPIFRRVLLAYLSKSGSQPRSHAGQGH